MQRKGTALSTQIWILIGIVGLVGGGLVLSQMGIGPLSAVSDDTNMANGANAVSVDAYGIDGKVSFGVTPSSADVCLFEYKPENWGNYVEFALSDAKDGHQSGSDYQCKTGVTTDTAVFDDLESGSYYLFVKDANYHPVFTQVEQPETVPQVYADNDKAVELADGGVMYTTASYGSDNVVLYDEDGNVLATGSDLPTASSSGSQTFKLVRTVEVETGTAFLGSYAVTSFNADDGVESVSVEIMAGDETYQMELKDGSTGELADSTSFGEDITDMPETEPIMANGEIKVVYTVTLNRGTSTTVTAGDGVLQADESIFTTGMDDIFGNTVGSSATISYTG